MKKMHSFYLYKLIAIALCMQLGLALQAIAQSGGNISYYNQAAKLFKSAQYFEAAQLYEKFLVSEKKPTLASQPFSVQKKEKGKNNISPHEEAVYNLAASYRLYNDYEHAEKWYQQAAKFNQKSYPASRYWYAVTLRANGKYQEAVTELSAFMDTYTGTELLTAASKELDNLSFIQQQLRDTAGKSFMMHVEKKSNHASAYALAYQQEDTVVFTSMDRSYTLSKNKKGKTDTAYAYSNQLFSSVEGADMADKAAIMRMPGDSGFHNGLAAFSPNGKKMFFTRWKKTMGKTVAAIYTSTKTDTGWTEPVALAAPVNMEGYSSAQPFITSDSSYLLFASDQPGGVGKYDLWYARLDSSYNILFAENMGNTINTAGDDECPFYHQKSRTLLFSNNTRTGMGGFDVFYASNNFSFSKWSQPVNAGIQVNSSRDDLYYTSTDDENLWNTGWLSSDRQSECCLELYEIKQKNALYVSGVVIDSVTGKPLTAAKVMLTSTRHGAKTLGMASTDTSGRYHFDLHNASAFRLQVTNEKYIPYSQKITVHFKSANDSLSNQLIALVPAEDTMRTREVNEMLALLNKTSTLGNFEYNKVKLNNTAFGNLDSLVALMNKYPTVKIEVAGYTDGKGTDEYNIQLAQARIDVCIRYLVRKGINASRIVGKAMGRCCPLEPDSIDGKDNPDGRAKNRRVEYKML